MSSSPSKTPAPFPAAAPVAAAAAAPEAKRKAPGIVRLHGSLPRIVGYGLMGLFLIDIAQGALSYRPLMPDSDAAIVMHFVERVGVPLVAYALIFATDLTTASRRERTLLKLVSSGALLAALIYLMLGGLAAASSYRLIQLGGATIERQTAERVAALEQAYKQVPNATLPQLFGAYRMLSPNIPADSPVPSREEMITAIDKGFPPMVQSAREAGASARSTLRKQQAIFGVKYAAAGLLSAILFLVIWENTRAARGHRIFAPKNAPTMKLADKLVGGFSTLQSSMEDAFFLSSLQKYRWYRKLKRFFGGKR